MIRKFVMLQTLHFLLLMIQHLFQFPTIQFLLSTDVEVKLGLALVMQEVTEPRAQNCTTVLFILNS